MCLSVSVWWWWVVGWWVLSVCVSGRCCRHLAHDTTQGNLRRFASIRSPQWSPREGDMADFDSKFAGADYPESSPEPAGRQDMTDSEPDLVAMAASTSLPAKLQTTGNAALGAWCSGGVA